MTYSIVARDEASGEMGLATHSFAFAVGASVPWAEPGYGVIATQSIAEPYYGELGLDLLRGGMTAEESLHAMRSVDPHPERRQVAMIDDKGHIAAYTGEACVAAAGHATRGDVCAMANMAATPFWDAMVDAFHAASGPLAHRLLAALDTAEAHGGDVRGRRSAAIVVVRAERTGRPWQDRVTDLRVDDHPDAVTELGRLVRANDRYHQAVHAFETALDGDPGAAAADLDDLVTDPAGEPDLAAWQAVVLALADRTADASRVLGVLQDSAPGVVEGVARLAAAGLVDDGGRILQAVASARS